VDGIDELEATPESPSEEPYSLTKKNKEYKILETLGYRNKYNKNK
jgi:hypothetical protein